MALILPTSVDTRTHVIQRLESWSSIISTLEFHRRHFVARYSEPSAPFGYKRRRYISYCLLRYASHTTATAPRCFPFLLVTITFGLKFLPLSLILTGSLEPAPSNFTSRMEPSLQSSYATHAMSVSESSATEGCRRAGVYPWIKLGISRSSTHVKWLGVFPRVPEFHQDCVF